MTFTHEVYPKQSFNLKNPINRYMDLRLGDSVQFRIRFEKRAGDDCHEYEKNQWSLFRRLRYSVKTVILEFENSSFNVLYYWTVLEYVLNGARGMDSADSKLIVYHLYFWSVLN